MAPSTTAKPPSPSFSEKGYVKASRKSDEFSFSQWEAMERVPDLQHPQSVETYRRMMREDSRVTSLLAPSSRFARK